MNILDKMLGKFGLSWSGDYSEYYNSENLQEKPAHFALSDNTDPPKEKIAILRNSRCTIDPVPKERRLAISNAIEERMTYFRNLPYQIGSCFYIGDQKAWTEYNWNNKRTLELAINEINFHLSLIRDIPEAKGIIPLDYQIIFNQICFDFGDHVHAGDLPRSYIIYAPITKKGKHSQYPLIAFFNTIRNSEKDNNGNNYTGELFYSINGELSKANITCIKHGKFADIEFSVVGRTFLISKIKTLGADGKLFTLYDCVWDFTDNIDFADTPDDE